MKPCPDCSGYGYALAVLVEGERETPLGAERCPACGGSGEIRDQ